MTDFSAPQNLDENLLFRLRLLTKTKDDVNLQAAIIKQCSEDIVFFCNSFAWTYAPKAEDGMYDRPFIL